MKSATRLSRSCSIVYLPLAQRPDVLLAHLHLASFSCHLCHFRRLNSCSRCFPACDPDRCNTNTTIGSDVGSCLGSCSSHQINGNAQMDSSDTTDDDESYLRWIPALVLASSLLSVFFFLVGTIIFSSKRSDRSQVSTRRLCGTAAWLMWPTLRRMRTAVLLLVFLSTAEGITGNCRAG